MDADGGRWGNLVLMVLLVALLGMMIPVTTAARAGMASVYGNAEKPWVIEAVGQELPAPLAASAIGDHYHEWSRAIDLARGGNGPGSD